MAYHGLAMGNQAATDTVLTLHPVASDARAETAPLLPTDLVFRADGTVVGQHVDYGDEVWASPKEAFRAYEVTAVELLGADLDDDAIKALRHEAAAVGDLDQVEECEAATDGDAEALEECASVILAAKLEAIGDAPDGDDPSDD